MLRAMTCRTPATLALALSLAACNSSQPAPAAAPAAPAGPPPWTLALKVVDVPAAMGSSGVQLTSSDKGVLASWIEYVDDKATLKFSEYSSSGWSPATVVAAGGDWFVTEADTPAVLRLSSGALAANWLQSTDPDVEASNLQLAYSTTDGKTWSKPFLPHHDGTKTQHAFAALFETPSRGLGLVWLDGRQTVTDRENGPMSLRYAAFDQAWKQRADVAIDMKVCDCCTTTVATTADGLITAYRDRTDDEIRDIYVSRMEGDTWTPGTSVHADNWKIAACPINGPAISARAKDVVVAWFTTQGDQGQAFAAFSNDGGRSWGTPIRLDDSTSTGKVDVELLDDGSAVASWVEFVDKHAQLRTRRIEASGMKSAPIVVVDGDKAKLSGVPRLARHGKELVFAWNDAGADRKVKTAVATLP